MKFFLSFVLFPMVMHLFAQHPPLEQNPDNVLISPITLSVAPDLSYDSIPYHQLRTSSKFLKLHQVAKDQSDVYNQQSNLIDFIAAAQPNNLYKDKQLKQAMTETEVRCIYACPDTVNKQPIVRKLPVWRVKHYHLYGQLYYNKRDKMLRFAPVAIAPMTKVFNRGPQKVRFEALFWMPVAETKTTAVSDSNNYWIKRVKYEFDNNESTQKVVEQAVNDIFKHAATTTVHNYYGAFIERCKVKHPKVFSASYTMLCDTIITFDPATFEEVVQEVKFCFKKETIRVEMIQDWVWNQQNKQLALRPISFSPINTVDIKSTKSNFKFVERKLFNRVEKGVKLARN